MAADLPETIACTYEGCTKTMYLKPEGKFGPFYSHKEETAEKGYHTVNADKGANARSVPHHSSPRTGDEETPDWDGIARSKTRCAIFTAVVEKDGLSVALESKNKIELAVSYVMNGLPTADEEEPTF